MQGIFISYRRQDSQSAAGRLADHLKEHMHGVLIFRDVETIEPGVDFVDAISHALQSCGVLLAVIGPRWVSLTDTAGKRRLEDPNDYTRLEIATALRRDDVRVIPVLVENAEMPAGDVLPDDLKALSRRNAIELTDKRWEYDVSQLVETLKKALNVGPTPIPPIPPRPVPEPAPQPVPPGSFMAGLRTHLARHKWAWGIGLGLLALGAYYAEEGDVGMPVGPIGPVIYPMPADVSDRRAPVQPSSALNLTGNWQDDEGGGYQLVQQGIQVAFQGISPHGPAAGAGTLQGQQLTLNYAINGYPYQAALRLSPDGRTLQGRYRDPATGESGPVHLQRSQ